MKTRSRAGTWAGAGLHRAVSGNARLAAVGLGCALWLGGASAQQQAPASPAQVPASAAQAPESGGNPRAEIARDLFERGKSKWLEGQFDVAVSLLAASDEQLPVPSTLALLADSYEQLGRLKSASDTFHRAARLATEKNNSALAHSASTREAALGPRIPRLEIRVTAPVPAGLLVTLNGVEVPGAQLNAPIAMDAGHYQLEAHAPGYLPSVSLLRLINDRAQPAGPQIASVMLAPEPIRAAPGVALLASPPDARAEDRRVVAWWLAAGGAAALVTGGVVMLVSWAKYVDSRQDCKAATGSSRQCPRAAFEERNTSLELAGVATGVALTGAALLGTGITLYLLPVRAPESVAPVGAGVGLRGAF